MLGLLTSLPVLYVCNVDEATAAGGNAFSREVEAQAAVEGAAAIVISAKIEAEIAILHADERETFLSAMDLNQAGLDRLIRAGYRLWTWSPSLPRAEGGTRLDSRARRRSFASRGRDPHRFRTRFHPRRNDRLRGLRQLRGRSGGADAGKMRLEGKDYVVQDGDVMHFRFATGSGMIEERVSISQ